MESTVSLKDILITFKKRWMLIVLITLLASSISGAISNFLTPIYQASTQILVNQKTPENQLDYSKLQSNVDLINTYIWIIKSRPILEKVIDKLDLKQSVEQLNQNITITTPQNAQVFLLTVEHPDPKKAVEIANTVSAVFQEEVKQNMKVDNVSIWAPAELKENPTPIRPKPLINIAIAMVIGLMSGMGLALLLDFMDNTLKDDQDVAAYLGMPVLGSVHKMSRVQKKMKKNVEVQNMGSESIVSQSGK